jgi:hypothetical protein
MSCAECERLRSRLSPLENKAMTESFLQNQPIVWMRGQVRTHNGVPAVVVQLPELWRKAFGGTPSAKNLTELGRTLVALGWMRTKRNGLLWFALPKNELGGIMMEQVDAFPVQPIDAPRAMLEEITLKWRDARAKRLDAQKVVDELERQEKEYKEYLVSAFLEQKFEGFVVGNRITTVTSKDIHIAEDRAAVEAWVLDNKALEVLQFRLSETAIKEREANGIVIPGIGIMKKFDLSDKKA